MACTLTKKQIEDTISFHGHWCPGLAYGIRAAEWVLTNLCKRSEDEEIVTITETDMCAVDAIQFLTGCTFGKGNLLYRNYGKSAFTFFRRNDGKGFRLIVRQRQNNNSPEATKLYQKKQNQTLTEQEQNLLSKMRDEKASQIMNDPIEQVFDIQLAKGGIPPKAKIFQQCRMR